MSDFGLDFTLHEMADTIRDKTRRFAAARIAPLSYGPASAGASATRSAASIGQPTEA